MKKINIPFSLSEYQKGGYEVEDGRGRKVRIAFTDLESSQPILAAVLFVRSPEPGEVVRTYCENGQYHSYRVSDNDLVLIKPEFEDCDYSLYRKGIR